MGIWISSHFIVLFCIVMAILSFSFSPVDASDLPINGGTGGRRVFLGFKEKQKGTNLTFDCSLSGACVPCLYSEKTDEKYRCSETGYRIPLKCVEVKDGVKENKELSNKNGDGRVLEEVSTLEDGVQGYITYRSCIPPIDEEKLSVLGFEGIILGLFIISGSVVYFRRRQTATMAGVGGGRIQMARF